MAIPLRKYNEKLAKLNTSLHHDPSATLVQLRSFAKEITKCLYDVYCLEKPLNEDFLSLLTNNAFIDITNSKLRDQLHFLRIQGNSATHGESDPSRTSALALEGLVIANYLLKYISICDERHASEIKKDQLLSVQKENMALNKTLHAPYRPLTFDNKRLYRSSDFANLESAKEIGSIIFKSESPYVNDLSSLYHTGYQDELKELGIVSYSILNTTLFALNELDKISRELNIPFYQEGKSGIVWALKEAREGSIYNEFIAYAIQTVGDESVKTLIENGIYDVVKISIGAAFVSLPKQVFNKIKNRQEQDKTINKETNYSRVYSYECNYTYNENTNSPYNWK
ncbi:hypothetical protein [Vibrio comitans]|uniref:DUF4145 domain-containing protein n=1 Tax=Vibrio comitans NBRC 102076 TaxID=1219078 RepID=A0A4Y3IMM3_9VIBR|nr:hypothetical protein [Vibrio comitans]GEA60375.1 hypothetical protein VCO01S_15680 [Vibrio comitans NBRC 102076]